MLATDGALACCCRCACVSARVRTNALRSLTHARTNEAARALINVQPPGIWLAAAAVLSQVTVATRAACTCVRRAHCCLLAAESMMHAHMHACTYRRCRRCCYLACLLFGQAVLVRSSSMHGQLSCCVAVAPGCDAGVHAWPSRMHDCGRQRWQLRLSRSRLLRCPGKLLATALCAGAQKSARLPPKSRFSAARRMQACKPALHTLHQQLSETPSEGSHSPHGAAPVSLGRDTAQLQLCPAHSRLCAPPAPACAAASPAAQAASQGASLVIQQQQAPACLAEAMSGQEQKLYNAPK